MGADGSRDLVLGSRDLVLGSRDLVPDRVT
jgi:hypothetical protein